MEVLENAAKTHSPEGDGQIIPYGMRWQADRRKNAEQYNSSIGPCDVTSKADLDKLVKNLASKEKYLSLLSLSLHLSCCRLTDFNRTVTNAGISGPKAPPDSASADKLHDKIWHAESVEDWDSVLKTNVTSVYFSTIAFLPLLQASIGKFPPRSPSVIVISSMSGIMRHSQGHFAYNAAKGATIHLSKLMSAEFEKAEVRVNSIAPGYFPSEMTMKESDDSNKTHMPAEKVQEKGHVPAQRPGSDEEMAQAVIFLCKNMYVNGELIAVDGGVLNQVPGR